MAVPNSTLLHSWLWAFFKKEKTKWEHAQIYYRAIAGMTRSSSSFTASVRLFEPEPRRMNALEVDKSPPILRAPIFMIFTAGSDVSPGFHPYLDLSADLRTRGQDSEPFQPTNGASSRSRSNKCQGHLRARQHLPVGSGSVGVL